MEREITDHHPGDGHRLIGVAPHAPADSVRMSNRNRTRTARQATVAILFALFAFPAACAPPSGKGSISTEAEKQAARALHRKTKSISWQEEVKLSTGEVIVIEHEGRMRQELSGPFASRDWMFDSDCLRFRYPTGSKELIEWCTRRYSASSGFTPELVRVLDVGPGDLGPYVITDNGGSKEGCEEYFRYRYENGVWRDDTLPEIFDPIRANMLAPSFAYDFFIYKRSPPKLLDLAYKDIYSRNERIRQRVRVVGPDRCQCGWLGDPRKSGCTQKYKSIKE